ncbi:MAG: FAD-binding oxidoreductase [Chloroflexi bacterium]|nr:FAD-binding oxidoreductase [Chloroflexota bacterium]
MKTTVFWSEAYPPPADLAASDLPETVDVAVVGSGYTGLNAAIALRKAGASVAVLEQATIGAGASSRNGGMATTGLKEEMRTLFRRYGAELGQAFWQWSLAAITYVEQSVAEEEIACDFVRSGHVTLACKPQHYERFAEEVRWFQTTLNYDDLWVVDRAQLQAEIGSNAYYGGLVDRNSAALQPARYVFGLAQAATRRGAQLVEEVRVRSLARMRLGFRLNTTKGSLLAREVLIATNGYTTPLVKAVRQEIFPAGSYIIVTQPLPVELQRSLSPRGRMFFDSKHFLNYFRLTPDGRMLFGGRHDLSTSLDLVESAYKMQRRMVEVFPQLAEIPITHSWNGKLGLTVDRMPHAGRVQGIHYAGGYAGHGVAVASYLGREMGEVIAGQRTSTLFAQIPPARHPWVPYDRLYLPLVSSWFRTLDKLT